MKVCVTGGRPGKTLPSWYTKETVFTRLDYIYLNVVKITELIEGEAFGIDQWAAEWARGRGIAVTPVPVLRGEWAEMGRGAGSARNKKMLDLAPDLVLQFPGGAGTADMVEQAKKRKIPVIEIEQTDSR